MRTTYNDKLLKTPLIAARNSILATDADL